MKPRLLQRPGAALAAAALCGTLWAQTAPAAYTLDHRTTSARGWASDTCAGQGGRILRVTMLQVSPD